MLHCRQAAKSATQYSYSDLMRDLDREIDEWQKRRVEKKGKRAESVTDVLGDLADEFLDFLEGTDAENGAGAGAADKGAHYPLTEC